MEISKGNVKINNHDIEPTDINILGFNINGYIIIKYMTGEDINYTQYYPERRIQNYLFFEIVNKSPLWNITFNFNSSTLDINFIISIEPALINNYIKSSISLSSIITDHYNKIPTFSNTNLINQSFIPYLEPIKPPEYFKINLYDYQQKSLAKMVKMENNNTEITINYTYNINFKGCNILYDPVTNLKSDKEYKFKIKTSGGVLSDDMGLGKTITSIALIASNPAPDNMPITKISNISKIEKINSKASLIICPSHLAKQWENEIKRCNPNFKIITILTKTNYDKLTFENFIDSDIIITSHQFIMNFKFYPRIHYRTCTSSNFDFEERNHIIKLYLQEKISTLEFSAIKKLDSPIFEFFNFHRIILDEGHEIFGEMLNTASLDKYMSKWVSNIDANFYWYVSGTPFINYRGVMNCARFINLTLEDTDRQLKFNYLNTSSSRNNIMGFMNKNYIWENIMNNICIRHRKIDVENQVNIYGHEERIIWLKFTDLERELYDAKKYKVPSKILQQLCCHPLIVESSKKIFGDIEVDLSLMQEKLIEYHKTNCEKYKIKLSELDPTRTEYYMLKKSYETQLSESKYIYNILEKMNEPEIISEETCSICIDILNVPTLTACGHLFCNECIKKCLCIKKICPICKSNLSGKELMVMNIEKDIIKDNIDPLVEKYGSKLGNLIIIIKHIVSQKDTRIIVFSQWDDMLSLVGKTLVENGIDNCFVKGNVWSRNSSIDKFKDGVDNKVIMLSLKNAASGTNLTEATHIFFVEPINSSKEESKAIESQAIARACRVGQKQKVILIRILIENSIEETIYRKNYNNDVVISLKKYDPAQLLNNYAE